MALALPLGVTDSERPLRVLLCHERVLERELITIGLTRRGIEVVEAVASLDDVDLPGNLDAVLVSLPSRGSARRMAMLRKAAEDNTGVAVVVLARDGDAEDVADAFAAGARGFVTVATSMNDLARALRQAVRGQTPLNGASLAGVVGHLVRGPAQRRDRTRTLTPREREVVALLVEGMSTTGIADALDVSPHTARCHVKSVLAKFEVRTRGEAAALAVRRGVV